MGGLTVQLPRDHAVPSFVPCVRSFTANAFSPAMRHTPKELAQMAPKLPTVLFMQHIVLGEPMTVSRAQCIYRHLRKFYVPHMLAEVLRHMALPGQEDTLAHFLTCEATVHAHPTFVQHVQRIAQEMDEQ